jgi:non-canonical (house-cleaning) NTP pyrophosphatase
MYNPNTALLGDFEEEEFKAKLLESTVRVAVAALDPAKIQATVQGISIAITGNPLGKEVDARGFDYENRTGIPDVIGRELQDNRTSFENAKERAQWAFQEYERQIGRQPHCSIAFEIGIDKLPDFRFEVFTWTVIYNGSRFGSSRTQSFEVPPTILMHLQSTGMLKRDAERLLFGGTTVVGRRDGGYGSDASVGSASPSPVKSATSTPLSGPRTPNNDSQGGGGTKGAIVHMLRGKMTWPRFLEPSVILAFLPFEWNDLYSIIEL